MKKICLPLLLLIGYVNASGQQRLLAQGANVLKGTLVRVSDPFHPDRKFHPAVVRNEEGIIGKAEQAEFQPVSPYPLLQQKRDEGLQSVTATQPPESVAAFDGLGYSSVCPADPTMAVGPNHIVQMVNDRSGTDLQIWDKAGNVLMGKKLLSDITGVQGYGDCIALYDALADRFILTEIQFGSALGFTIAISATGDPLGAYYTYVFPNTVLTDYPKYSVWTNAYFAKTNDFRPQGGSFSYVGETLYAFDKQGMLKGNKTIDVQTLSLPPSNAYFSMCPAGIAGTTPPPAGTGGLFAYMNDNTWTKSDKDSIGLVEYSVDFANPANSNLTATGFAVAAFDPSVQNIAQPRYQRLDALSMRVMNQPVYRQLSTSASLALAFPVLVNKGKPLAGIRWFELKIASGTWQVKQQSTFSPDNLERWLPSISIDAEGGIGLAYNVSGLPLGPSIRFTGRRSTDPLNTMTVTETSLQEGSSGSNCFGRYGDYNHLVIDPSDNRTFWFTAMYNSQPQWSTKIGSFTIGGIVSPALTQRNTTTGDRLAATTFGVYPNPAHDKLTVSIPSSMIKPLLQVLDMNGKVVGTYRRSGQTVDVSTASLPRGIYLLRITAGNTVRQVKFAKE